MNKLGRLILLWLTLVSCQWDGELDVQDVTLEQSYFVECYMRPGELFNLTATEISPIFEDYILDYSQDFDVYIIDSDTIELFQSLFIEEGTGYVYNFGSGQRLSDQTLMVELLVLSPMGDTIRARSRVPEQIKMENVEAGEDQIVVNFLSSDYHPDNYYILIANYDVVGKNGEKRPKNKVTYLDYHELLEEQEIVVDIKADSLRYSEKTEITLMRVTEENFRYQRSLEEAKNASRENVTFPAPLEGNLINAVGIFTCYTEDKRIIPVAEIAR
ncbi:DUF4249 domain-containing protein [Reichenbachiella agarivorans]|uniref:DUF4249 domain-containing protein n=1 Tax=Reichenbachiella agarivorans TaxID=2979464 RepID=A0ABY6CYD0_9BACT|nr:DUF4249 domain-containing protein [Reichenbachiella agarivorans]UXP33225.1 DUF4249 domain-containing protein [Reichenbachiella agarivorans]